MPERTARNGPLPPLVDRIWSGPIDAEESDPNAPDLPLIPTDKEVASLPRAAWLAFAARCARRVAPIYAHAWPDAPEEHRRAVRRAVRVAEDTTTDAAARAGAAFAAASAADAAGRARVSVALDAARAVARANTGDASFVAAYTARSAADTLVRFATLRTPLTRQLRCIRRDFDRLAALAKEKGWTADTRVTPDVFGPMWPDGAPPWWTEDDGATGPV